LALSEFNIQELELLKVLPKGRRRLQVPLSFLNFQIKFIHLKFSIFKEIIRA